MSEAEDYYEVSITCTMEKLDKKKLESFVEGVGLIGAITGGSWEGQGVFEDPKGRKWFDLQYSFTKKGGLQTFVDKVKEKYDGGVEFKLYPSESLE
jgi:hypothetical protein